MDPRVLDIVARQQAAGFRGLAGSDLRSTIRVAESLINEALAVLLPPNGALRSVTIHPHASDRIGVRLTLAKPAFLPPMTVTLAIQRQPQLPDDPILVLQLTGGAGVLRLAAPAITSFGLLPPGVRMDKDQFLVDVRMLMEQHGQAQLLDYVEELRVSSEQGAIVLGVTARVPAGPRPGL